MFHNSASAEVDLFLSDDLKNLRLFLLEGKLFYAVSHSSLKLRLTAMRFHLPVRILSVGLGATLFRVHPFINFVRSSEIIGSLN